MSHPKEAWKFRMWSEAMLRGATVGNPEYKGKRAGTTAKPTGSRTSRTRRRKRRRKKKQDA